MDNIPTRAMVVALLLLATLHAIFMNHAIWTSSVLDNDFQVYLQVYPRDYPQVEQNWRQGWSSTAMLYVSTVIIFVANIFNMTRVYNGIPPPHPYAPVRREGLLAVAVGLVTIAHFAFRVLLSINWKNNLSPWLVDVMNIASGLALGVDALVTIILSHYSWRSGFHGTFAQLIRSAFLILNSGIVACGIDIAIIILATSRKDPFFFFGLFVILVNVYICSALSVVNTRNSHTEDSSSDFDITQFTTEIVNRAEKNRALL